jgi:P27 family predicted phage terminase small subunit
MSKRATPTQLKRLHGNPGRRKLATDEPEGVGDVWSPPAWFDAEQRLQWDYAVAHAPLGLLTGTDREILVIWVAAAVEHAKAVQKVRELGQLVQTEAKNTIQNPYLPVMNRQALIMMKAGGELGFSPASRAALGRAAEFDPHAPSTGQPRNNARLARYLDQKPDKLDS